MLRRFALALTLVAFLGATARAGTFTTQIGITPFFADESIFTGGESLSVIGFGENSGLYDDYQFQADALASGEFESAPVLHGLALLSASYVPYHAPSAHPLVPMRVQSQVTFTDTPTVIDITKPIRSPITVTMTYTISGKFVGSVADLTNVLSTTGGAGAVQNLPQYDFGGTTFTSTFTVLNRVPYDYSVSLFVSVIGPTGVPPDFPNPDYFHATGAASFVNSMRLTGLSFADADGAPIDAELRSSTDELYVAQPAASPVPEPSSMLIFVVGLAIYGIWHFRQVRLVNATVSI